MSSLFPRSNLSYTSYDILIYYLTDDREYDSYVHVRNKNKNNAKIDGIYSIIIDYIITAAMCS